MFLGNGRPLTQARWLSGGLLVERAPIFGTSLGAAKHRSLLCPNQCWRNPLSYFHHVTHPPLVCLVGTVDTAFDHRLRYPRLPVTQKKPVAPYRWYVGRPIQGTKCLYTDHSRSWNENSRSYRTHHRTKREHATLKIWNDPTGLSVWSPGNAVASVCYDAQLF